MYNDANHSRGRRQKRDVKEVQVLLKKEIDKIWKKETGVTFPWLILTDADGVILVNWATKRIDKQLSQQDLKLGAPIEVDDQVVGWLLYDEIVSPWAPGTTEWDFLEKVRAAIWLSAGSATAAALLLGVLLARAIARPVHELTAATRAVAGGELGHQVTVRSRDDLGELARSFNRMSADLARSSKLRRQMTVDIAHDLRTPLSIILGYTEALSGFTVETRRGSNKTARHG